MSVLNKRLRKLEDNVAPAHIEWGSTRLSFDDLSETEREVHFRARKIVECGKTFEDLTGAEKAVIDKSYYLLSERCFDIFTNFCVPIIFGDDKWAMFCFASRFHWIIHDVKLWAKRLNDEHELFEEAEKKGYCEGELAERETQITKGTKDLFTRASFLRFYKEEIKPNEKPFEFSEEELASLPDEDEEDQKYVADEYEMRTEKCPNCTKKPACLYWKDKQKQELFQELYQKYYPELDK